MPKRKTTKDVVNDKILDEVSDSGLTQKEQDFILYYLESNNASQSYMKAYSKDKKLSAIRGYELLHKPSISSEIKRLKKIMRVAYDIDPSRYIETLLKAANADIGDYISFSEEEIPEYNDEGLPLVNPDTGEPITRKINKMHLNDSCMLDTTLITEIKQGRDGISIKLVDKLKAWEKLRDYFDWKERQTKSEKTSNSLVNAIGKSAKDVWGSDIDEDLNQLKESENGEQ